MNVLLDPAAHPIIAHRGASADAPENTLPAFRLAVEHGAEAIELDVRVTADDVPVVIHDPTLDRTTDAGGAVETASLARVRQADAGARFTLDAGRTFPWRGRGVCVPSLEEVLDAVTGLPLLIELKTPRAQQSVRRVLLERGAAEQCVLAADDATALAAFREPAFRLGAARREIARLLIASTLGLRPRRAGYRLLAVPPRHQFLPVATRALVRAANGLGCPVHVWTINDVRVARRLWERGVSGIITDVPRLMRAARDEAADWR